MLIPQELRIRASIWQKADKAFINVPNNKTLVEIIIFSI
jgi:hypothetical protein